MRYILYVPDSVNFDRNQIWYRSLKDFFFVETRDIEEWDNRPQLPETECLLVSMDLVATQRYFNLPPLPGYDCVQNDVHLLNRDWEEVFPSDIEYLGETFFIKHRDKMKLSGTVVSPSWRDYEISRLNPYEKYLVSSYKEVDCEIRAFVVDGKVIGADIYSLNKLSDDPDDYFSLTGDTALAAQAVYDAAKIDLPTCSFDFTFCPVLVFGKPWDKSYIIEVHQPYSVGFYSYNPYMMMKWLKASSRWLEPYLDLNLLTDKEPVV